MIPRPDSPRGTLFGLPATDPNVRPDDVPRLAGQNEAILARLRRGPATNRELAGLSLKYTSRMSDLRAAGHSIECIRAEDGLTWYRLIHNP